jgi:hypothetical protein
VDILCGCHRPVDILWKALGGVMRAKRAVAALG